MKYLLLTLCSYVLCAGQAFLSLYPSRHSPSSSCLDCSFPGDVLIFSLASICMPVALFLARRLGSFHRSAILAVLFMAVCGGVDYFMVVERVSSWSTFTIREELFYTASFSYPYMAVSAILFVSCLHVANRRAARPKP